MLPRIHSPLIRLSNLFPNRKVYAKCEFLATSGCFKIRGAVHLLEHLRQAGGGGPLIVPSMGNTAIGAGTAAKAYGTAMVGVVPRTISTAKDERLRVLGVELIKIEGGGSDLLRRAKEIANERNGYFVHPHLDPLWTDGYQTIMEEILEAIPDCRSLVFPVGGGGLLLGLSEYLLKHPAPMHLYGCEPYNYPKYARFTHQRSQTIADGLVLEVPHALVRERIDALDISIEMVHESEIRIAMRDLFDKQALVVEPSSAISIPFVAAQPELAEPICVVQTGSNISREHFDQLLSP